MLSKRLIDTIGLRIRAMSTCGASVFNWDKTSSRIILPETPYMYWNWCLGLSAGYLLCILQIIQLFIKFALRQDDLPDEAILTQREANDKLKEFAVAVIGIGELLLLLVICLLAQQIHCHRDNIMYLMNQLFDYHDQVQEMLATRQIVLDANHKRSIRNGEFFAYFMSMVSYLLPCVLMTCVFHPLELIHVILQEWFEFELELNNLTWIHLLFLPFVWGDVHAAGNTIITLAFFVTCYYQMATLMVQDISPVQSHPNENRSQAGIQCTYLETTFLGTVTDEEIIHLYRIQQVFLAMVNEIMAAFPVSAHHVATLATASILMCFVIKFNAILQDTGMLGYVIVYGSIVCPFVMEYWEAKMLGKLADISITFKENGEKCGGRKTLFRQFLRSCSTFHVQEAYPYYTVSQSTFLQFGSQVVDYTITLLLW